MSHVESRIGYTRRRSRWSATTIILGAFVALVAAHPSTLQAQAECEDVSGVYLVDLDLPGSGQNTVTLTLEQSDCQVTGTIEGRHETPIETGEVEGSTVTFTAKAANQGGGGNIEIVWETTVDGDDVVGTLTSPMMGTVAFTGERARE